MENNTSFNAKESINILKNGVTIFTIIKGETSFFKYEKNKIFSISNNSSFYISIDDFLELYALNTFYIYDNSNETIDSSRDVEYYSINKIRK